MNRTAFAGSLLLAALAAPGGLASAQATSAGRPSELVDPALLLELRAEEAPPLERLTEIARQRSPRLAELRARLAAAIERVGPAGELDDPMLEAALENIGLDRISIGDEEMSRFAVAVRQELPFPGKRGERRARARAEAAVAAADLEAAARALDLDVARGLADVYAAERELELLDESHQLLDLMGETMLARYGAGEGDQRGVLRVQRAISRHDAMREQAARRREESEATLRGLLALPAEVPIRRVPRLWAIAPVPERVGERAADEAPAVAVRRAAAAVAERELELERLELKPDFSLAGGLAYRGDFDPGVMVGAGVELPFWRKRRQEPRIRAAEQELAAARAAVETARLEARAEAERQAAAFERLQRSITLYREGVLPQSAATFEAARAGYFAGRGAMAGALDDLDGWIEARVELVRLEAERAATAAAIAALIDPDSRTATSPDSPGAPR
jgi:outer membrane protein TolC